jgi:predicted transcriptional regulator
VLHDLLEVIRYTEQEIAETLGLTERTVRRDWDKARLLLMAALKE